MNIDRAVLPPDNSTNYDGATCVMAGWGRTSASLILPDTLQKANIKVIPNGQAGVPGSAAELLSNVATIWNKQIAVHDSLAQQVSACDGDAGGALMCNDSGELKVVGLLSWVVEVGGNCIPGYPTISTRVGAYLDWIANLPLECAP